MARPANDADDTLIELFLDMLAAERGARENTLQAYKNDLADFGARLAATGIGIAAASSDNIRDYLATLSARGFQVQMNVPVL